jgi:hypothetical protein
VEFNEDKVRKITSEIVAAIDRLEDLRGNPVISVTSGYRPSPV